MMDFDLDALPGWLLRRAADGYTVRASYERTIKCSRPWVVYVDGKMLRTKRGVGRRFATEDTALLAGLKCADGAAK